MKTKWVFIIIICMLFSIAPLSAQTDDSTAEDAQSEVVIPTNPVQIFVCIEHRQNHNLLDYIASAPVGLMFTQDVNVTIYASQDINISVDLISVEPDTATGTYRWVETIVNQANVTNGMPVTTSCENQYPELELETLNRSISIPASTDQSIVIRRSEQVLDHEDRSNVFINGAVGIIFRDQSETGFPHMQLLRFRDGNMIGSDDTISLRFPDFSDEPENLYIVSRKRVSYIRRDSGGFPSVSKFIDPIDTFISQLHSNEETLLDNVLTVGQFRMYVAHGEAIEYPPNGQLEIGRLNSYSPRNFENALVRPIGCTPELLRLQDYEPPIVAALEIENYSQYANFNLDTDLLLRYTSCTEPSSVEDVLDNGILLLRDGFYLPSWLVDVVVPE